jgi:hypothetical protein
VEDTDVKDANVADRAVRTATPAGSPSESGTEPNTAPQPIVGPAYLPTPRDPKDVPLADGEPRREDRIEQLERRLHQLELLVWGTGGDDQTELDLTDPELVALAKAAEYAQTLSRMLVTPRVRAACEETIEACREWQQRYDQSRDTAIAASRAIATTRADQERHREAVQAFEVARAELNALRPRRQRMLNTAQHARLQLAHDREVRDRYGRDIADGHRAWATLNSRLRVRTAAAVERGEPLPTWLVESLGVPPSSSAAEWRELAIQLLAYRITYAVTDPVDPLAAEPSTQDSPRRRQWHRELQRQLDAWRGGSYVRR